MVLRTRGPRTIFTGHRLVLHVDFSEADKVGVFYSSSECLMPGSGGEGTDPPDYRGSGKMLAAEQASLPQHPPYIPQGGFIRCTG